METKKLQSMKQVIHRGNGERKFLFRYALMVLILLTLGVGNAWGSGAKSNMAIVSADTGQGLVYMKVKQNSTPSDPGLSDYVERNPSGTGYTEVGSSINAIKTTYFWAKPARGYKFKAYSGYQTKPASSSGSGTVNAAAVQATWDGVCDKIETTNGGGQSTNVLITASFEPATSYNITYAVPVGGSYNISYKYLTINSSKKFEEKTVPFSMTSSSEAKVEKSYAADVVTLSTSDANFAGWYEGTTQKSTATSYTYPITQAATITAVFKLATLGTATGDLSPAVKALGSNNYTITVPVTAHGSWSAGDFTVAFAEQTSPARSDITKGTVTYSQTSGNVLSSEGTLTIPFTYNPASWGNTDVLVTVTPATGGVYGTAISFHILASATEPVTEEAQLWENGVKTQTGTLVAMVNAANALSTNPTVKLMQDKTIDAPLSLQKSMKFDLNDKKITSTSTSAFSIDVAGIDVQIVDEGFGGIGEITTQSAQSGNVSVVTFTQKAKLTMQGGTLSAKNTGSGSAYGINVTQGSTFYMTNGLLTVTGVSEAQGVHVATASDYATLNGGSITVSAPTKAYGVWSAGQSNVTNATISAETTTGANAYGVYVNGGVSTLTTNTVSATAKTTGAYAAYVNAGRLNGNGGSFAAEAVTSGVYGVHVAAGATAMLQMNAVVTAEATGASGTSVFGVNNLGMVSLTNVSVTATSPTTAATAVNTATSATSTTIEGGTYRANTTGGTAYGLHHQYGTLNVDGGEFKAVGSGNTIYGARAAVDATIANATIHGETQGSGNTAYGFVGATEGKNITLTNCAITGLSATSKAYAIYSRANVTATNCDLTATTANAGEAYGLHAEKGTNKLTNCDATVSSNTTTAYGVNHVAGTLTIDGGTYDVTAKQATTSTAGNTLVYGVYNAASQTTTIKDASFTVTGSNNACSQLVYGVYAKGILNSTNSTYTVTGRQKVYGIYGESTLNLSGNTISAAANGASTNGTESYGIYAKKDFTFVDNAVRATATSTKIYALFFEANTSEGTIADGKYYAMGNGTTDFAPLNASANVGKVKIQGGVYSTIVNIDKYLVSGYNVYNLDNEHPDFATGHRFIVADENPTPYVCYIKGGNKYTSLEAAMQYTKDNSGNYTIIMTQDYTLPEGDYELPSNATLLVPRNADQTGICGATPARRTTKSITVENLRLTLAAGVHINVNGKIEVGGEMYCAETGQISYVCSEYGRIHMEEGSLIQLNSGSILYAWGYITGKGEIKAKNNSEVHEMFQIGDMKSMSNIAYVYNDNSEKYFFINQYYIQNIEVPTTYYFNSRLISAMASFYNNKFMGDDNVKLVGTSGALFLVTTNDESSWVRKSYDAVNDYQVWEVNSQAQLGSITIDFKEGVPVIGSATFNSSGYYLPITNNMKIHVLDGDFAITQSSELLPGASVEIDKTASLTINSGKSVYVFDNDQWPLGITQVAYSPSWKNGAKPTRTKVDAALNVHGKIVVKGSLYTTNSISDGTNATNGANIYSNNEDAGTVSFATIAASSTSIQLITSVGSGNSKVKRTVSMEPAKLKNNDGSYAATAGTQSGEAWIYMNNHWQKTYTNGCFEVIGSTVYAKPSGYVALKKSQTVGGKLTGVEETNHTYLTADDKILILMDECQWWEVVATSDPTVFECKKEGYEGFYYYDSSSSKWKLKTVTVTFYQNETGSTVLKNITTSYNGIPDQAVIATNPTKGTTAEYTYSFYGWKSSVTGTEYKWTDQLEVATADMSYRPVFTATKRNYTITLVKANNGANVPLEVPYGEMPSYTAKRDADAQYTYSFEGWSPALQPVTGTATYTATWSSVVNNYNITWMNGETVLEVDENQPYGTATAYNHATPTKDADDDYEYAFSKWKSSLNGNSYNNGSTPTVAGETTYEAQYTTTPRYAVTFNNYNGVQLDRIIYTQGQTPAYSGVPARKRDDNGYFKFIGWKNSNGTDYAANATLPAVTKKETYTAQYEYVTDLFTITLKNVEPGVAEWSGTFGEGAIPFYNKNNDDVPVTPTKSSTVEWDYTFDGWSQTVDGPKLDPMPTVSEDATYYAHFAATKRKYTITWKVDGQVETTQVAYGTNPVYPHGTPTKAMVDQYTYTFEGWSNGTTTYGKDATLPAVTGPVTYTAQFQDHVRYYTITWKNWDGTVLETDGEEQGMQYGAAISYDGATPSRDGDGRREYTFTGWSPEVTSSTKVNGNQQYIAQYSMSIDIDEKDDELVITGNETATATTVRVEGRLNLSSGSLTTNTLILEASLDGSGQILGGDNLTVNGDAYFDLSNGTDGFLAKTWYAVAVPWQVAVPTDGQSGIFIKKNNKLTRQTIEGTCYVIRYDGARRASTGENKAWNYLSDISETTMKPGVLYMIYLNSDAGAIRFQRAEDAPLQTTSFGVSQYESGEALDAGWNGIANPSLYHAYLKSNSMTHPLNGTSASHNYAQKYVPIADGYDVIDMSANPLPVGQPVFVQVPESGMVVAYDNKFQAGFVTVAPRRAMRPEDAAYEVQISAGQDYTDRLFLQVMDGKEDRYQIGLDLAKASTSSKVAQMWVNRYDAHLCVNTTAPVGSSVTYPLGIYAPKEGDYQINSVTPMQSGQELFVTLNGRAIWNLAYGPYTATLSAGTHTEYGLKLIQGVPAVETGIDQTQSADGQPSVRKVIIDNQVYIIRGGEVYSVTGQKSK